MPPDTTPYPRGDTGPARRAARIANHRRRILKLADELTTVGYQLTPPDDLDAAIAEMLGLAP